MPAVLADESVVDVEELPTEQIGLSDVVALAPPAPPPPRWKGRVDFGWALAEGNRSTELGTLTALAERERGDRSRLLLLVDAAQGSSEGEETANRARLEGKLDTDVGDSGYRYFLAGAGYDSVRDVELRMELGSGVGRTLVDRGGQRLVAEWGVSYVRDSFTDGQDEADAKLRLGERWQRELGSGTLLRQTVSLLTAVDELSDYTAEFMVGLTHRLSDRLSLTSKLVNSYDSRPVPGTERNDLTITTQLGVAFGE
jgi:putative salt-induced outer membrane protein YdiY